MREEKFNFVCIFFLFFLRLCSCSCWVVAKEREYRFLVYLKNENNNLTCHGGLVGQTSVITSMDCMNNFDPLKTRLFNFKNEELFYDSHEQVYDTGISIIQLSTPHNFPETYNLVVQNKKDIPSSDLMRYYFSKKGAFLCAYDNRVEGGIWKHRVSRRRYKQSMTLGENDQYSISRKEYCDDDKDSCFTVDFKGMGYWEEDNGSPIVYYDDFRRRTVLLAVPIKIFSDKIEENKDGIKKKKIFFGDSTSFLGQLIYPYRDFFQNKSSKGFSGFIDYPFSPEDYYIEKKDEKIRRIFVISLMYVWGISIFGVGIAFVYVGYRLLKVLKSRSNVIL